MALGLVSHDFERGSNQLGAGVGANQSLVIAAGREVLGQQR